MLEGIRHDHKRRKKALWSVAAGLTMLVLAVTAGFFYMESKKLKEGSDAAKQATTGRIIAEVGKLYELPKDEEPTVAQIQDKSKLEGQAFFDPAQDGDYVLVYAEAKVALLYREESGKLVNVGPVSLDAPQPDQGVAGENTADNNGQ